MLLYPLNKWWNCNWHPLHLPFLTLAWGAISGSFPPPDLSRQHSDGSFYAIHNRAFRLSSYKHSLALQSALGLQISRAEPWYCLRDKEKVIGCLKERAKHRKAAKQFCPYPTHTGTAMSFLKIDISMPKWPYPFEGRNHIFLGLILQCFTMNTE